MTIISMQLDRSGLYWRAVVRTPRFGMLRAVIARLLFGRAFVGAGIETAYRGRERTWHREDTRDARYQAEAASPEIATALERAWRQAVGRPLPEAGS